MFEAMRKKSVKKSLLLVIILMVIGIIFIGIEFTSIISILRGHKQFETLAPEEIKEGIIVDANINANFGVFIEEYEENTKTHVTRTTDLYYIIWTGDEYAEDYRYMGIKVPVEQMDAMDEMTEATYYYWYTEPIQFSGEIQKMNSEEYGYLKDYFLESGFTEDELDDYIIPYYINVGALCGGSAVSVFIFAGIGLVLVLIGAIALIRTLTGASLKAIKKELQAAGIGENEAEYEYENARLFSKGCDIRIGRRLTFYMVGNTPHIVLNDKLVWAYQKTTTHRTNGIKTGTTYSVCWNTYDRKAIHLAVSYEQEAIEILQCISQCMPWAVVGYSDELSTMYHKAYPNFLQLRYNNQGNC